MQGHLTSLTTTSDGLVDRVDGAMHFRLPPGVHPTDLEMTLAGLAQQHGITLTVTERMQAAQSSKRTPLVATLLAAIRRHGGEPRLLRKTGTADFNHLAQWFPGVPLIAYGPGDAALDHTPDERISLQEFEQSVLILRETFNALATLPEMPATTGQ